MLRALGKTLVRLSFVNLINEGCYLVVIDCLFIDWTVMVESTARVWRFYQGDDAARDLRECGARRPMSLLKT